jgi:hypothetical protein
MYMTTEPTVEQSGMSAEREALGAEALPSGYAEIQRALAADVAAPPSQANVPERRSEGRAGFTGRRRDGTGGA